MKSTLIKSTCISILVWIILVFYQILKDGSLLLLNLSNIGFLIGLFFLSIGLFLLIWKSGFFDFFSHSMLALKDLLQGKGLSPFNPKHKNKEPQSDSSLFFILLGLLLIVPSILLGLGY